MVGSLTDGITTIGTKTREFYSSLRSKVSGEEVEEDFTPFPKSRDADLQLGITVVALMLLASFLSFWALIAVIGNASVMSEKMTFYAAFLLFLTPVMPFAPILSLVIVYRTRAQPDSISL